jgi:signal transduction histidine kinase
MSLGVRSRLTLAIVLITLAASTIVGVGLGRFTRSEFKQFLEVEEEVPVALPPVDTLVERLGSGDLSGARAELESMGRRADGARLLLFGPDGGLIADTRPEGEAVLHDDGRLEVVGWSERDDARQEERLVVRGGIELGESGASTGTLFVLPARRSEEREIDLSPEVGFTRSISRAHLVGIAIATGLALVIALVLSGRIVGPVETLTAASRGLAQGDLSRRVDVRSNDEIGELSGAFNAMAESLERQETVRRNMVSDIAHELRTPLTHLRCKLESVQDGLATADEEMLSGVHEEILHLGRLVDDLQELALAEAGQLPMFPVEADLLPIVRQVIATVAAVDGGPSVTLEEAESLSPATVDVDRFRQVLRNLVENALRHGSPSGRVVVRVCDGEQAEAAGMIQCEVQDDGPGVAPEHLERVFDRFHRTDPARGRATGGAGLGLAISRQLVLAWGGAIGVESQPGQGARFWFTVPVA